MSIKSSGEAGSLRKELDAALKLTPFDLALHSPELPKRAEKLLERVGWNGHAEP